MRERARDKGRLEDIVEYSNNVVMLVEGYTFEALVSDKRTYYSVIAVGISKTKDIRTHRPLLLE